MSRSASPSITQFFKAQRKRPLGSKEDGSGSGVLMSASKKLLLEEGISVSHNATSGGYVEEEEDVLVKPVVVVSEQQAGVKKEVAERKKKKATTKKKATSKSKGSASATQLGGGEQKISGFVRPATPSSLSSVAEEKGSEEVVEETAKDKDDAAPQEEVNLPPVEEAQAQDKTRSNGNEGEQEVPPPVGKVGSSEPNDRAPAPDPSDKREATSKGSESPVKFMKVGALSPTKRKKMTSEQVAKLLKKKTKLAELRSTLEGINQCAQKITDFRRTVAETNAKMSPAKPLKEDGTSSPSISRKGTNSMKEGVSPAQFYSPTADRVRADLERLSASKVPRSPSKLVTANNKIKKRLFEESALPAEKEVKSTVPAYQRFHSLAQKTPAERDSTEELELSLPYHFKVLKEMFTAVETVAGIMKRRKETMIFPKVRAGVLELMRKISLREKHLAQMVTVLPGCYSFGLEKVGAETHIKLIVDDELPPTLVCARRKEFHSALIKICLEHHQNFLLGLAPPIIVPADKQITRWHPQFKLDEIPDIVPKENALPVKPTPDKISTAREVIAKAQNILENANPRMRNAMKNMLNKEDGDSGKDSSPVIAQPNPKTAVTVKALKGVSSSLLEKIRNREREKLLNEMTRSPAESKKLQMTKRMPDFIKIIRNMMVAEKKVALPLYVVVDRISHSIQNMSTVDTEAHVRLLATLLPKWIRLHKLSHSDTEYVRIEKVTDINYLLDEMDEIIRKLVS